MDHSLDRTHRRRSMSPEDCDALQASIVLSDPDPLDLPSAAEYELNGEDDDPLQDSIMSDSHYVDRRIQWIHVVLGCAVLLPWNALITATPYFLSRLSGSGLGAAFSSYLSLSFTAANFAFLAYATVTAKHASYSRRIFVSTIWLALLNLLLTATTFARFPPGLFFSFVIVNGIVQAGAGSFLQTSVMAVASLFGPATVQAVMSGQGAIAVVISGVQVVSAAVSVWGESARPATIQEGDGAAEELSAFIFFLLSTLFLVVTTVAHQWLVKMPGYKSIVSPLEQRRRMSTVMSGDADERQGLVSRASANIKADGSDTQIWRIARANAPYELAVAYVYVVTLAVFPPITTLIQSTGSAAHPLLFSSIHFLVFNVGDFGGRYLCSYPRLLVWSARRLLPLSFARTLFIPLFLMCNIQRPDALTYAVPIINSDSLYLLILLLFGVSNGYVSSMCMMSAPSVEHNPRLKGRREDVDIAATLASFFLVGGLAVGSVGSFGVRAAVCNCNPFTQ